MRQDDVGVLSVVVGARPCRLPDEQRPRVALEPQGRRGRCAVAGVGEIGGQRLYRVQRAGETLTARLLHHIEHTLGIAEHAARVQHLRDGQQLRCRGPDPHRVIAADERAHRVVGLGRGRVPDRQEARAGGGAVLPRDGLHEEAVGVLVEPERIAAKARDLGEREARVAVPDQRDEARQLDDDLVPSQRRDARAEGPHGATEALTAHAMEVVAVLVLQRIREVLQVRAPLGGCDVR
jgi:hypothetical protein